MSGAADGLPECPNCGTALDRHYCPECGQKAAPVNPTFHLIGYGLVAFRTAYGGRWRLAAGRTAFVLVTYMLVVMVVTVLTTIAVARMG